MLNTEDTEYIKALALAVTESVKDRDAGIRIALESGGGAIEVAKLTGLTRARIYQIRDAL